MVQQGKSKVNQYELPHQQNNKKKDTKRNRHQSSVRHMQLQLPRQQQQIGQNMHSADINWIYQTEAKTVDQTYNKFRMVQMFWLLHTELQHGGDN